MAKSTNTHTNRRTYSPNSTYIEGNTVRKTQTDPKKQAQARKKSQRQLREERERRRAADRNLERAMVINRGYVAFLTVATVVCFVVCLTFIYLQSGITQQMASITAMETELSNQKAANDLAESHLETSMTLDEVKDRAVEMGLVYPQTSQIQYFSVENSDYMNQYTDVASK